MNEAGAEARVGAGAVPLYRRVYDTIIGRIVGGELRAGAMLPSEADLGAELGVSQGTARRALTELERNGVVERRQGRGTFVAVTTPERALFHFFRLRRPDGTRVVPDLLSESVRRRRASAAERTALGSDTADPVFEVSRVRAIDGRPRARETMILSARLFPGLAERAPLPNTLYAFYQQAFGVAVVRAEEALSAVAAQAADAEGLGIAEGTPLLQVERRASDISGRVVELRRSRYLTDTLTYNVHLR